MAIEGALIIDGAPVRFWVDRSFMLQCVSWDAASCSGGFAASQHDSLDALHLRIASEFRQKMGWTEWRLRKEPRGARRGEGLVTGVH